MDKFGNSIVLFVDENLILSNLNCGFATYASNCKTVNCISYEIAFSILLAIFLKKLITSYFSQQNLHLDAPLSSKELNKSCQFHDYQYVQSKLIN
uniref:Putative ovule protein n=1 Tax=Solanum chacoense TaxID=4108 RepID=A0A0V0HW53_SOLCH